MDGNEIRHNVCPHQSNNNISHETDIDSIKSPTLLNSTSSPSSLRLARSACFTFTLATLDEKASKIINNGTPPTRSKCNAYVSVTPPGPVPNKSPRLPPRVAPRKFVVTGEGDRCLPHDSQRRPNVQELRLVGKAAPPPLISSPLSQSLALDTDVYAMFLDTQKCAPFDTKRSEISLSSFSPTKLSTVFKFPPPCPSKEGFLQGQATKTNRPIPDWLSPLLSTVKNKSKKNTYLGAKIQLFKQKLRFRHRTATTTTDPFITNQNIKDTYYGDNISDRLTPTSEFPKISQIADMTDAIQTTMYKSQKDSLPKPKQELFSSFSYDHRCLKCGSRFSSPHLNTLPPHNQYSPLRNTCFTAANTLIHEEIPLPKKRLLSRNRLSHTAGPKVIFSNDRLICTTETVLDALTCMCLLKFMFAHCSTARTTIKHNNAFNDNDPTHGDTAEDESRYYRTSLKHDQLDPRALINNGPSQHRYKRGTKTRRARYRDDSFSPGGMIMPDHCHSSTYNNSDSDQDIILSPRDDKLSWLKRVSLALYSLLCPCMWCYWPLKWALDNASHTTYDSDPESSSFYTIHDTRNIFSHQDDILPKLPPNIRPVKTTHSFAKCTHVPHRLPPAPKCKIKSKTNAKTDFSKNTQTLLQNSTLTSIDYTKKTPPFTTNATNNPLVSAIDSTMCEPFEPCTHTCPTLKCPSCGNADHKYIIRSRDRPP